MTPVPEEKRRVEVARRCGQLVALDARNSSAEEKVWEAEVEHVSKWKE